MKIYLRNGLFGLLLLISTIGIVFGAEPSGYTVYVQGAESSIDRSSDGIYKITIQDVIPFSTIFEGDELFLFQTKHIVNETNPMNAVLILSGSEMELKSLIEISSISMDTEQNIITFLAHPLEFNSGELLKPFLNGMGDLDMATGKRANLTALYLEIIHPVAENKWNPQFPCCVEGPGGQCYMKC